MRKKNVLLLSLTFVAAAVLAAFFIPIPVGGQEGPAKPGSPAYRAPLNSTVLPPPPKFGGVIKDIAAESTPWWPPRVVPPKGAPNVLLILLDDTGYGSERTFGGTIPTPSMDRLAERGPRYTHFHSASLGSPTRAALISGRNHHTTPIAPCEGNPSWNSQMLTHQRPGVRSIQKGGYHVSAPHERHPWASPTGIRLGCPGDGRDRSPDAHTGRSTRPVGAVQGGDHG
jgi:hypothetical protein